MLELHKQLPPSPKPSSAGKLPRTSHAAKKERDRELIQRQIDATDRKIDQLVYKLYGLTAKEIRIVEEAL